MKEETAKTEEKKEGDATEAPKEPTGDAEMKDEQPK